MTTGFDGVKYQGGTFESAQAIIDALGLEPLPLEGGYFRRTYEADVWCDGSPLGGERAGHGAGDRARYHAAHDAGDRAGHHAGHDARGAGHTPRPRLRRRIATAIYYLITEDAFSALHRLASDEIFHFYLGDPVEMLRLYPDGSGDVVTIGADLAAGMQPQVVVPRGVWQGSRLVRGGRFALLGTTVSPGFEYEDYEHGNREALIKQYPEFRAKIEALTRPGE